MIPFEQGTEIIWLIITNTFFLFGEGVGVLEPFFVFLLLRLGNGYDGF